MSDSSQEETLASFLERVIDDGIAAARRDYAETTNEHKLAGSIAGFEECRGRSVEQLAVLIEQAHTETKQAFRDQADDYWFQRCRELEIEWVCNCVSAVLMNEGRPMIIPPTARSVMKAAEIVGVGDA